MRDFKGMKRQRGRNRGGGGQGGGGGGGKPQHNINRAFDSQGPDNIRVRGNAQTVYEKYQGLARDATLAGDRVLAENHLQHAEHYFRTLRAIQPNRAASEIVSRDSLSSNYDIDFEDEAVETAMEEADAQAAARTAEALTQAASAPAEGEAVSGGDQPRFDRAQGDQPRREWRDRAERQDRPQGEFRDRNFNDRGDRQDRPQGEFRGDRQGQGQDRQGQDRQGQDRQGQGQAGEHRGDRPRFRDRDDRFRDGREPRTEAAGDRLARDDRPFEPRGDRPRFRDRDDRSGDGRRFEPRESEAAPAAAESAAPEAARTEPRAEPVLRSEDGGVSQLPGFLQSAAAPATAASGEEGERTRRPRRRRSREDGDAPAAAPEVEEA